MIKGNWCDFCTNRGKGECAFCVQDTEKKWSVPSGLVEKRIQKMTFVKDGSQSRPAVMDRAGILHEAERMVCGHREQDYGSPEDNFAVIAQLWTTYTGHLIKANDVAMMMALLKIARIKSGTGTADSYIDLAGYAACGGEIAERRKNEKK